MAKYCRCRYILLILIVFPLISGAESWRLDDALALEGISLSGSLRARFESLDGQYRGARGDSDQALVFRNRLALVVPVSPFAIHATLLDARQALADDGSAISTGMVNSQELVETYLGFRQNGVLRDGDSLTLKLGRQTLDVGSRRLVSDTIFRNTTNTYTGASADWLQSDGTAVTAFYVLPVTRLPALKDALLDNEHEHDTESSNLALGGVYVRQPLRSDWTGEFYLLQLDEQDSASVASRDRDLLTAGFRLYSKPKRGEFDYEIEAYYQTGESALTTSDSAALLDHRAYFGHAQLGYRLAGDRVKRLMVLFDYASGDDDPNDDENNRFDNLYGARRFDFGPTGIYGPFPRENLTSLGVRAVGSVSASVDFMTTLRSYRLASASDAWTTAKLRDATGAAGKDLGEQWELKLVWHAVPGNLDVETGAAYLHTGKFADAFADNGTASDSVYSYLQAVFHF